MPPLTLKFGSKAPKKEPIPSPSTPATPLTAAPKLKLKFGTSSQTPAPAPPPSATSKPATNGKPKPARKTKPTPKKRALEIEPDSDDNEEPAAARQPPIKKIKLKASAPSAPIIHLRAKGKPPKRPKGVGYDSEADDREIDPTLSEAIILRMEPGEDCDILRQAVAHNNFGSRKHGGVDVRLRFLRSDGRRAIISIQGRHYAAILVDLPCVIEAMKSWFPKQGWMKSADVCQMLMVLGRVEKEEEAASFPLRGVDTGELDEKTWQWAHGVTPPMRWVRKRRFRKRISVRTVMEVEAEVEALLKADEEAGGNSRFELVDERRLEQEASAMESEEYEDREEDAEGEDNQGEFIETVEGGEEDEAAAAARLAAEMEADMMGDDEDPSPNPSAAPQSTLPSFSSPHPTQETTAVPSTPATPNDSFGASPLAAASPTDNAPTPGAQTSSAAEEEEEEDEDDDEEESSDEDEDEDVDEEQRERQQDLQRQREEIADLEAVIRRDTEKVAAQGNVLLRRRMLEKIRGYEKEVEIKRASMGLGDGGEV
ncbi:hypothetical protein N7G274_009929 [Stereocaulon virgatum]|uniref:TAFII55 protein conserved region domain-containing protein n=1 Tax=Stereocaulon virgatum TaxID=373712 RepID=A0ABR3ZVQ9_9LECA